MPGTWDIRVEKNEKSKLHPSTQSPRQKPTPIAILPKIAKKQG